MRNWMVGCAAGALLFAGMMLGQDKPGDAAKGKMAVQDMCSGCHATDTDDTVVGPPLKGLFKRKALKNGKPVNDANVLDMINTGGNGMPPFGDTLSAQDKSDVLAYLKTL